MWETTGKGRYQYRRISDDKTDEAFNARSEVLTVVLKFQVFRYVMVKCWVSSYWYFL
jgi:hypothetical protein